MGYYMSAIVKQDITFLSVIVFTILILFPRLMKSLTLKMLLN